MIRGDLRVFVLLAITIETCAGCERTVRSVSTEGKVTLDNKPLTNATVTFTPTKANGPGPFVGTTDNEGRFALQQAETSHPGAVPGEYSVLIATVRSDPNSEAAQLKKEIVPNEYRSGAKRYEIPPDGTKEANFDMRSRK
jgi:hypothetical protein